jgi:hypothetical protein
MNELIPVPRGAHDEELQAIFKEIRILREQHGMMARSVKAMHDELGPVIAPNRPRCSLRGSRPRNCLPRARGGSRRSRGSVSVEAGIADMLVRMETGRFKVFRNLTVGLTSFACITGKTVACLSRAMIYSVPLGTAA